LPDAWYAEGALQLPALPIGSKNSIGNYAASCNPAGKQLANSIALLAPLKQAVDQN
jgi:hypothetical protein